MRRGNSRLGLASAAGLCLLLASVRGAGREEPPSMEDACLNDHAGLLGARDAAAVRAVCDQARKKRIAITVVTIRTLAAHKSSLQGLERFVDDLFDELDVEYEDQQNAILLFVAQKEREIRVRIGDGYPDRAHKLAASVIRGTIGPKLGRAPSSAVRLGVERLWQEIGRPRLKALEKEQRAREQKRGVVNFEDDEG